ncbi:hypothetical protein [Agrococcus pavilionensis]|uniref:hypothetical protein n=1 Tax=Agrococcus pavilionensis TaxID=1346502 RepID=UPI0011819A7A|nr:hypothetical protein [Agrococcus pavilionensis]
MITDVVRFAGAGKLDPSNERGDTGSFRIVQRWGAAVTPVRDTPAFRVGQPVDPTLALNGEWWTVSRDTAGRFLVMSDPYSLQPLFYASVETRDSRDLLVGGNLAAVAQAMHLLGAKVETDWAAVLPSLATKRDFFDTMWDVGTAIRGVTVSLPGQALLVNPSGHSIVTRPEPDHLWRASYEDLLRSGAAAAIEELQRTFAAADGDKPVLNLSGGKDSRLVLALMIAAGLSDRVCVSAQDPRGAKPQWKFDILDADLAISSRLTNRFGLDWRSSLPEREVWPDSLESQLADFQLFRGARSYQFFPLSHNYRYIKPAVRITGAGAGTLKSPWRQQWEREGLWAQLSRTPGSLDEDAHRILRSEFRRAPIPRELEGPVFARFSETLLSLGKGSIDDAVMNHYGAFRNRGHVGGMLWARDKGAIVCNPLLQPALQRASMRLPAHLRDAGRVTFDLLELLLPEMNDLEFQSGAWPWSSDRPQALDWSKYPSDRRGFFQSQDRRASAPRPQYKWGPNPDMTALIRSGLSELREAVDAAGLPGDHVVGPIQVEPPEDRRGQGRLLARLATWGQGLPHAASFARTIESRSPRVFSIFPEYDYTTPPAIGGSA